MKLKRALSALLTALLAVATTAPIALATACQCRDNGSPIILDDEAVRQKLVVTAEGPACDTSKLECMQRDAEDRCQVYWIVPRSQGRCIVSLHLGDGRRIEEVIDYGLDEDYPCRGEITTEHRHVTHFSASPPPPPAQASP
jgi:hypothetical protein